MDPSEPGRDFTDLHAWAEVYIPGAGWIGFDATSGLLCGEGHMPLAASPHYRSSAAITGAVSMAETAFEFEMNVSRLVDTIRITRPFDDAGWDALDQLGERVEADLQAQDVRLTMGGEPTFVSIDDFEAAEWNTDASGPTKPVDRRATDGAAEATGSARAACCTTARANGIRASLCRAGRWGCTGGATASRSGAAQRPVGTPRAGRRRPSDALALIQRLAGRLGVDPALALPAREDPLHWIKAEGDLPPGVELDDAAIDNAAVSRTACAGPWRAGFPSRSATSCRSVAGSPGPRASGWLSEAWRFKRGRLYLVPGDSPIGLRLPLGGLPPLKPEDYPYIVPVDPYEERGPLPGFDAIYRAAPTAAAASARAAAGPRSRSVRTAIAIEPRDGVLCVFMPPLARLEDYLELVAQLEVAAEGPPRPDRRLYPARRSSGCRV